MRTGILSVSKFVKETTFLIYGRYIKEVPFPSKMLYKRLRIGPWGRPHMNYCRVAPNPPAFVLITPK